ncbi:hypothetical protein J6590_041856 [Homalodisca vitripennis]|nr:hypothetical protein J6590_041856 [Homalodisca vitripennis]
MISPKSQARLTEAALIVLANYSPTLYLHANRSFKVWHIRVGELEANQEGWLSTAKPVHLQVLIVQCFDTSWRRKRENLYDSLMTPAA